MYNTPYIFHYDIAAIVIFIVILIFHFQRKNLPLMQNRTYLGFVIVALLNSIADLLTVLLEGNPSVPAWCYWLCHISAYVFTNTLPVLYLLYSLSLANYFDIIGKKRRILFEFAVSVPYITSILLILISPITYYVFNYVLVFFVDDAIYYHRGGWAYAILFFFTFYYILISLLILWKYRKIIKVKKYFLLLSYVVLIVIAVVIQLIFPHYLMQSFGISLAAIMFSSLIQTPDEYIDRTTQLFNEAALIKMTQNDFASKKKFLVLNIFLDDIVFITNAFGINQMNSLLREVSDFLREQFPQARHYYIPQGKFCIVFKSYNPRDIEKYVFYLRARFHETWVYDTLELKLYSRICVIECPKDAKNSEDIRDMIDLISDDSRYKRQIIYARDMSTEYKKRTAYIAHLLRNAIAEKRFDVYYQPIYSTKEDRLIGAEALIRMKDEDGNFVSPEEFIPISEKTGDILRIGQFVFDNVCKTLSSVDLKAYGIKKIDINLSVAQCMQEILADQILTIRTIHNVPASVINLEITETAAAHTPEILLRNMNNLAKEGIELSLDDYGSGYSNMNYLLNLPFKMVKLDKEIVWTAFSDKRANIALASTIQMIKKLGMSVLAEGVETKAQAVWLTKLGCDYLQGFLFAKGLPKDEFLTIMKIDCERFASQQEEEDLEEL